MTRSRCAVCTHVRGDGLHDPRSAGYHPFIDSRLERLRALPDELDAGLVSRSEAADIIRAALAPETE
jgi:hypothetical protein